jgi:hypothetical protein
MSEIQERIEKHEEMLEKIDNETERVRPFLTFRP